jgi:hypothetical protein
VKDGRFGGRAATGCSYLVANSGAIHAFTARQHKRRCATTRLLMKAADAPLRHYLTESASTTSFGAVAASIEDL